MHAAKFAESLRFLETTSTAGGGGEGGDGDGGGVGGLFSGCLSQNNIRGEGEGEGDNNDGSSSEVAATPASATAEFRSPRALRQLVVELVLATDLSQQGPILSLWNERRQATTAVTTSGGGSGCEGGGGVDRRKNEVCPDVIGGLQLWQTAEKKSQQQQQEQQQRSVVLSDQRLLLKLLVKSADISNPAKVNFGIILKFVISILYSNNVTTSDCFVSAFCVSLSCLSSSPTLFPTPDFHLVEKKTHTHILSHHHRHRQVLPLYLFWTERILEEFYDQGDEERSLGLEVTSMPMCDRNKPAVAGGQKGFIAFVVRPNFANLADFTAAAAAAAAAAVAVASVVADSVKDDEEGSSSSRRSSRGGDGVALRMHSSSREVAACGAALLWGALEQVDANLAFWKEVYLLCLIVCLIV